MELKVLDKEGLADLLIEIGNEYLHRQSKIRLSGSGNEYNFEFVVTKIGE